MIGNIVTSVVTKRFPKLQLALSVLASDRKLIEHLHEYGITSIYQKFWRFKVSAAALSDNNDKEVRTRDGLIQIVADNFDARIHSQNGLKETHNMATIIPQPAHKYEPSKTPIPRLKQENLKSVKLKETGMKYFKGQKNPLCQNRFANTKYYRPKCCVIKLRVWRKVDPTIFCLLRTVMHQSYLLILMDIIANSCDSLDAL